MLESMQCDNMEETVLYCVVYCLTFRIAHQFSLPGFGGQTLSKLVAKLGFAQSKLPKINSAHKVNAVKPISLRIHPVQGIVKDYVYSARRRVKRDVRSARKVNGTALISEVNQTSRRSRRSRKTTEQFAPTENYSEFRKHIFDLVEELFPPPTNATTPEPTFSKVDFPPNSLDMEMGDKFFDRRLRRIEHGPWKQEYDDFYNWFYEVFEDIYRFRRRQFAARNYTGTMDYTKLLQSTPFKIPTAYKSYFAHVRELERIYNIHPHDPPDVISEMLDSGWNFNESALEYLRSSEEERIMKKTITPPRTYSWEDSESELKREAKFCFPQDYDPIHRPFYQWFFEIMTSVRRKGKKAHANLTLDHINIMDSGNYEEEMKNTPFPIPREYASFYPHAKKLKLAFDGVIARHNDTHFTVIETPSTKKIRKSTPIPPWKRARILNPRNESSIEDYSDGRPIKNLTPFYTVRSGRRHSLRTMTWEDKIKAQLWVIKAQRYKRGKTPTTPNDQNPLYSKFYVWHREALKFVGGNVAKINFETDYSKVPKHLSTPFPVPENRRGFFYVISDYIRQAHEKDAQNKNTSRWRP